MLHSELTDSNIAPSSPIFPLGVKPRPPMSPAPRSLKEKKQSFVKQRLEVLNSCNAEV